MRNWWQTWNSCPATVLTNRIRCSSRNSESPELVYTLWSAPWLRNFLRSPRRCRPISSLGQAGQPSRLEFAALAAVGPGFCSHRASLMRSACLLTRILLSCPCCRQLRPLRPLASSETDGLCSAATRQALSPVLVSPPAVQLQGPCGMLNQAPVSKASG